MISAKTTEGKDLRIEKEAFASRSNTFGLSFIGMAGHERD